MFEGDATVGIDGCGGGAVGERGEVGAKCGDGVAEAGDGD